MLFCRSVSEKFDLGKSSLNDCVRRVVQALNSIGNEVIRWPMGQKLTTSKEKFMLIGEHPMPGVVGSIDGCYIFIKKPNSEVFLLLTFGCDSNYSVLFGKENIF